jgi:hypothetical protein
VAAEARASQRPTPLDRVTMAPSFSQCHEQSDLYS